MNQKIEKTLERMRIHEQQFAAQFAVSEEVGKFLYQFVLDNRLERILELGTWRGASAIYLAAAVEEQGVGSVISVNLPNEQANMVMAQENIQQAGLGLYVNLIQKSAIEYLRQAIQEKRVYDLIFIDADKANIDNYVKLGLNLLSSTGHIIVDDVRLAEKLEFLEQHQGRVKVFPHLGNGVAVLNLN